MYSRHKKNNSLQLAESESESSTNGMGNASISSADGSKTASTSKAGDGCSSTPATIFSTVLLKDEEVTADMHVSFDIVPEDVFRSGSGSGSGSPQRTSSGSGSDGMYITFTLSGDGVDEYYN